MLCTPQRTLRLSLALLLVGLVLPAVSGCDAINDVLGNGKEVNGTVEAVGTSSITLDAIVYTVNDQTTFKGISGLSEILVGDQIEIGYEEQGTERIATEVEGGSEADGS